MPVVVEGVQGPIGRDARNVRPINSAPGWDLKERSLEIALINNMPDSALEDTEEQFANLLGMASEDLSVRLNLFSLPGIPRSDLGRRRLQQLYFGFEDLWQRRFDAVIITGTEPKQADLPREPYWPALTTAMEWAETNTISAVMSCLAAHASVLYADGIRRRPLREKRFGVFGFQKNGEHPLTARTGDILRFPQSRWNEVKPETLESCGYTVLAKSPDAGADLFVKKSRNALFVHFQGHPEYSRLTLLKEYRRDVRRFLKREYDKYPLIPRDYLDASTVKLLTEFQKKALECRSPELMSDFPEAISAGNVDKSWSESATSVYRNWLQYTVSRKGERPSVAVARRARSAASL
jgi:homoserine O-succinyltransferase